MNLPRELAGVATAATVREVSIMCPTRPRPGVTNQAKKDIGECNFRKGEEREGRGRDDRGAVWGNYSNQGRGPGREGQGKPPDGGGRRVIVRNEFQGAFTGCCRDGADPDAAKRGVRRGKGVRGADRARRGGLLECTYLEARGGGRGGEGAGRRGDVISEENGGIGRREQLDAEGGRGEAQAFGRGQFRGSPNVRGSGDVY